MIALFVGLRLYAVLGQRTGHEQRPLTRPEASPGIETAAAPLEPNTNSAEPSGFAFEPAAAVGVRSIIAADSTFDVARFLEGAQSAYQMVLEAFWKGDREELGHLASPDVVAAFDSAIRERDDAGHRLDNRLVGIERAIIDDARLAGRTAEIDVRFDAFVAAVTRSSEGDLVAGSLSDAVPTHDIWTFRRQIGSANPNWLLVETDEAA
ncbi:MAG: Tim44/TimA family putative adaptor protein [Allosphingosinicella sp.]